MLESQHWLSDRIIWNGLDRQAVEARWQCSRFRSTRRTIPLRLSTEMSAYSLLELRLSEASTLLMQRNRVHQSPPSVWFTLRLSALTASFFCTKQSSLTASYVHFKHDYSWNTRKWHFPGFLIQLVQMRTPFQKKGNFIKHFRQTFSSSSIPETSTS